MRDIIKTVLVVSAFFAAITAFSQHLTYSEFMRITKINGWSKLENALSAKGYKYAGSKDNSTIRIAYWTRNCIDCELHYDGSFNWNTENGKSYSVLKINDHKDNNGNINRYFEYIFPYRTTYNTFLTAAKNNGYEFVRDDISDEYISASYIKPSSDFKIFELLIFYSRNNNGGYYIRYYPPFEFNQNTSTKNDSLIQNNISTKKSSQLSSSNNTDFKYSCVRHRIDGLEGYTVEYFPSIRSHVSGSVVIRVTVSPSGTVTNAAFAGGSIKDSSIHKRCVSIAEKVIFRVPRCIDKERTGVIIYYFE